eukprot:5335976-Heterocapsa_arctica.AAC.1
MKGSCWTYRLLLVLMFSIDGIIMIITLNASDHRPRWALLQNGLRITYKPVRAVGLWTQESVSQRSPLQSTTSSCLLGRLSSSA